MRGLLLFDIDGVIRDVAGSYRLSIQKTVDHFSGWFPTVEKIDNLKAEGCWNNDWDASAELLRRNKESEGLPFALPKRQQLIDVFTEFYFGGNPEAKSGTWNGLIKNEPLLVSKTFFEQLSQENFAWGFVSGAERASAKYVLETRLGLDNPPLIAMGEAKDKPDPQGLICLARKIMKEPLGSDCPPIAYIGDTVADIVTINNARKILPKQRFISLGIAPPHLQVSDKQQARKAYEHQLKEAGANEILSCTLEALNYALNWK